MPFKFLIFFLTFWGVAARALVHPSFDQAWLRIYQYEKSGSGYRSDIKSAQFFFSRKGRTDPQAEWDSAIQAYSNPAGTYGSQKQPAACAFPVRKQILETILDRKFPEVSCPDLDDWVSQINADQAYVVFVGAYSGNPASILGHAFLRLANQDREKNQGLDLLSYSVGFTALPDPADNRLNYIVKGLTGGYDGFYEIDPHYMKVGIYNNSEARDLWEVRLKLSPNEVKLLVQYIWELTFNSQTPYYFVTKNCAYRLLKLIEALRPTVNLSSRFPFVVLPAEIVRTLRETGLADEKVQFRPSLKRRRDYKLSLLDQKTRIMVGQAKKSKLLAQRLDDPTAMDALLDDWIYETEHRQTKLDPGQNEIMQATFEHAAVLKDPSRYLGVTGEGLRQTLHLQPPFLGHRPSWAEADLGIGNRAGTTTAIHYRNGIHPFWSGDPGYQEISAIADLGFDYELRSQDRARWQGLLIDAMAIHSFQGWDGLPSWAFSASVGNHCALCETRHPQIRAAGGVGLSQDLGSFTSYLLAHLQAAAWDQHGGQGLLAPGILLGFKARFSALTWTFEGSRHWHRNQDVADLESRLNWAAKINQNYFLRLEDEILKSQTPDVVASVGASFFF